MPSIFYELEQAAGVLGVDAAEIEEMIELRELTLVKIGSRRLVHVRDVEKVATRVELGGPLRVRREFRGAMIPEAVRRAAKELNVPENELDYEVLEHATLRMPGVEGRPARIAVSLPDGFSESPEETDATPAEAPEPSDTPVAAAVAAEPVDETYLEEEVHTTEEEPFDEEPSREASSEPSEKAVMSFYAPEQVARLIGKTLSEVNLMIYRRELPTVNINDYLWVPEEAARELMEKISPAPTGNTPLPFRIVVPDEETATGAPVSRLDAGGVAEMEAHDPLRQRISELEGQVEALREEILRGATAVSEEPPDIEAPRENGHGEPETVPEEVANVVPEDVTSSIPRNVPNIFAITGRPRENDEPNVAPGT